MNSMTGFGRAAAQADRYNILVEISGVNRKQTEIAVNVPRGYAEWDASVRSIVQGAVSRGRVGVSISVERLEEADGSLQLDEQKLASLAELLNRASDLTGQPLPLRPSNPARRRPCSFTAISKRANCTNFRSKTPHGRTPGSGSGSIPGPPRRCPPYARL